MKTPNSPLTPEQIKRRVKANLRRLRLHNIPGMTTRYHHGLCIIILALCHDDVPDDLQRAIEELLNAARSMGMNIDPKRVTEEKKLSE